MIFKVGSLQAFQHRNKTETVVLVDINIWVFSLQNEIILFITIVIYIKCKLKTIVNKEVTSMYLLKLITQ